MKPTHSNISSSNGFSLIEVIATIIVMGILAAFFIHFMGTALDASWKSVELVAGEAEAEGTIEQIIADYVNEINSNPSTYYVALIDKTDNGDYGDNVSMEYIDFDDSGKEDTPGGESYPIIKVTVQSAGKNLTMVLTPSRTDSSDPKVNY